MNEREVSEIRRRFRADKSNITHIYGCYVNDKREPISRFDLPLGLMPEEEKEKYLTLLKRSLSGALGKNLIDITFRTAQVADSPEHKLLMSLRDSALKDEGAVTAFFDKVMESLAFEGNYLILLAADTYDVPYRGKDGGRFDEASDSSYSYILCAVCPVRQTKPSLSYDREEKEFHERPTDWVAAPPELGFLFPAFDNRAANLYHALYYTHDIAGGYPDFVDAVFHTEPPMPAAVQKETFQAVLADTLDEECSYKVVESVHGQLAELIEAHKESRDAEPLTVSRREVRGALSASGVSEQHLAAFDVRFDTEFGTDAGLSPKNLVDTNQFELRTPDVVIRVNPARRDLIETRVINGTRYILVCADDGVEVNGVNVHIPKD